LDLFQALLCGCYKVGSWEDLDKDVEVGCDGGDDNCGEEWSGVAAETELKTVAAALALHMSDDGKQQNCRSRNQVNAQTHCNLVTTTVALAGMFIPMFSHQHTVKFTPRAAVNSPCELTSLSSKLT
jgi:hypothetical protein